MSSNVFIKSECILLFLLLAANISSQRIRFPSPDEDDRPSGLRDCNCISIRRCPSLRNRRDWRTAGQTCEYRYRQHRKVCCPESETLLPVDAVTSTVETVPLFVGTVTQLAVESVPDIVETVTSLIDTVTPPPFDTVSSLTPEETTELCGLSKYGEDPFKSLMGGENATEGQWPWMAAIRARQSTGEYAPWCSGFLIDRRHVLSAAHCYRIREDDRYRVRVGSINQNAADEYRVVRITVPNGYTSGQYYDDIAVLTLDREVNFPNFNPVCLPNDQISKMDLTGRGLTVAGWGADRYGGRKKIILQYFSQLPVVSNRECQRRLRQALQGSFLRQFPYGISRSFICAVFEDAGKSACGGDSGGPQMIQNGNRWYAVGIVSFGFRCGMPGIPAGSTRVSSYVDWIRENMRD